MGVGGNTGKFLLGAGMEKEGGGTLHISSRQREGINEAIKAVSPRSVVGGRTGYAKRQKRGFNSC